MHKTGWNSEGSPFSRRRFLAGLALIVATRVPPAVRAALPAAPAIPADLLYCPAATMARLVRTKAISAQELTQAHLARIAQVNDALNAVCQLDAEGARAAARAADAALAGGEKLGPLHGVPITIKDSFNTRGIISTGGTGGRANFIPEDDATAVARLRSAGAIILGKTNTPELTLSYETQNLIYGRTNHPYDLTRTPGGSSGGSAAILAAGGSPLDLGSDTAGSIRIPAHFCGVAGLKPSYGRVSRHGHILPPGGVVGRRTHIGPMARFIEDLTLALPIISGLDPEDPDVVPALFEDPAKVRLKALRVAYFTENGLSTPTSEIRQTVASAVAALTAHGLVCREARPDGFEEANEILAALNAGDGGDYYRQLLRRYGTTQLGPDTAQFLNRVRSGVISGRKYSDVLLDWGALRESALKSMSQFDIILCPPCSGLAPKHGESNALDYSYSYLFNLLGWPAAVLRAGTSSNGLPIGIQVVGRPWADAQVLAVAAQLEKDLGGWRNDSGQPALLERS